jgi:hypothetical protein
MLTWQLDSSQEGCFRRGDYLGMADSNEKPALNREAGENSAPANDLLRTIEAYAAELRQIIRRLRKRLH